MFSSATSTEGWRERNFSKRTSLTVCVTRGLVTTCKLPPAVCAFLTSCTKAPKPELSIKSICDKTKTMLLGPSSIQLPITLRNAGSEKASNNPVRRNIW